LLGNIKIMMSFIKVAFIAIFADGITSAQNKKHRAS
jgi:hypothetical protein